METKPAQVVQDTLKTVIANTAKPVPLNESDISLSEAIAEHNQHYDPEHYQEAEEMIKQTSEEWAKDRRERLRKWQIAKDYDLFGVALAADGTLTAEQVVAVDEFLRCFPFEKGDS